MKKLIFILLLLLPLVNAIQLETYDAYRAGETVILPIEGNVLSSIESSLELKRGNVRVPIEGDSVLVGDTWFLWFVTPMQNGNYSLMVRDVFVRESGKQTYQNLTAEFEVVNKNAGYAIIPGAVVTTNGFDLKINSYLDINEYIEIDFPVSQEVLIKPGENKFTIPVPKETPSGIYEINVGQYTMPLHIISDVEPEVTRNKVYVSPSRIEIDGDEYKFRIFNPTSEDYEDIEIILEDGLTSSIDNFDLDSNESLEITVDLANNVNGNIIAEFDGNKLTFSVDEIENVGVINDSQNNFDYYCKELGGVKCSSNQICSGQVKSSLDGPCCVGTCNTPASSSGSNDTLGYIIGIVVLAIVVFILYKYRKSPKVLEAKKS